jgi:hypothetical protein
LLTVNGASPYFFPIKLTPDINRRYMPLIVMLLRIKPIRALIARRDKVVKEVANDSGGIVLAHQTESLGLGFLPKALTVQCQSLIESYHELHGYACLPDMLWKARLGPFIERHRDFRHLLRKASTTRSSKKSNQGFVRIATSILSLEILASSFAGWSAIYLEAGLKAEAMLRRNARGPHLPLMEFYLYPPKYISSAAIAALTPPPGRQPGEAELYRMSKPELSDAKQALNYLNAIQQAPDRRPPLADASSA